MLNDFRERGHRSDLDAVGNGANSLKLRDPAQIDHHFGFLDAVLEPIEAIHASSQDPAIPPLLLQQFLSIRNGTGLQQLKCRHNISDYGHGLSFRVSAKCVPSRDAAWAVQLPAKSRWCQR